MYYWKELESVALILLLFLMSLSLEKSDSSMEKGLPSIPSAKRACRGMIANAESCRRKLVSNFDGTIDAEKNSRSSRGRLASSRQQQTAVEGNGGINQCRRRQISNEHGRKQCSTTKGGSSGLDCQSWSVSPQRQENSPNVSDRLPTCHFACV